MNISFTCNNLNNGGAERVICNIANRMTEEGNQVQIICYMIYSSFYYALDKRVKIIQLDKNVNNRNSFIDRKFAGIINIIKLCSAVKNSDVIISFYTRQNCYSILAGRINRIPVICGERDYFFLSDKSLNRVMRKLFYPHANGFIHQTEQARKWLRENSGVRCNDIVIPNPLWIKEYRERNEIKGYVSSMGRLDYAKNFDGLIRAFVEVKKQIPYATLHIWGDGPQKQELSELIDLLGLQETVFLEGISHNVSDVYLQSEVFVLFSHGEGYPNVLMEALAFGTPSIASDCPVGGPRDMIQNGQNAYLVENENEEELASRIIELLSDSKLRELFSSKSISIRETNNFDKIFNIWMSYISEVIKR